MTANDKALRAQLAKCLDWRDAQCHCEGFVRAVQVLEDAPECGLGERSRPIQTKRRPDPFWLSIIR